MDDFMKNRFDLLIDQGASPIVIRRTLGITPLQYRQAHADKKRRMFEEKEEQNKNIRENIKLLEKIEKEIYLLAALLRNPLDAKNKKAFEKEFEDLQILYADSSIFEGKIKFKNHGKTKNESAKPVPAKVRKS